MKGLWDLSVPAGEAPYFTRVLYFGLLVSWILHRQLPYVRYGTRQGREDRENGHAQRCIQTICRSWPNTYYNNNKVGQIMGRITNDLFDVTEFAHCPEEFSSPESRP